MKKQQFPLEHGSIDINGHKMEWTMKRSKAPSIFGVRGSRIFHLELKKDGKVVGTYEKAWDISKGRPEMEDEEVSLCISYLVDKYGKETPKKKKEKGFQE